VLQKVARYTKLQKVALWVVGWAVHHFHCSYVSCVVHKVKGDFPAHGADTMKINPIVRNPLASPTLMAALQWLQPCAAPRLIDRLIRSGRVADAAALAEMLVIEADRP
jgi:hypothetical protein